MKRAFSRFPDSQRVPAADSNILEFLSTREGLELNKAFARIQDPKSRRAILDLVRSLAGGEDDDNGLTGNAPIE